MGWQTFGLFIQLETGQTTNKFDHVITQHSLQTFVKLILNDE